MTIILGCSSMQDELEDGDSSQSKLLGKPSSLDWNGDDSEGLSGWSARQSLSEWTSARSLLQASSSSCSSSFSPSSSFPPCASSDIEGSTPPRHPATSVTCAAGGLHLLSSSHSVSKSWPSQCESCSNLLDSSALRSPPGSTVLKEGFFNSWPRIHDKESGR